MIDKSIFLSKQDLNNAIQKFDPMDLCRILHLANRDNTVFPSTHETFIF